VSGRGAGSGARTLRVLPATRDRWADLERLFGERGACAGCWCMWWRLPAKEWSAGKGAGNRRALRALVASDVPPGLLAYDGGEPVGWVALAPRESYPRLLRSRTLKPIDDKPVWSISCFFVARSRRRRGVSVRLLEAAADHARRQGGKILEGYPVVGAKGTMPDVFAFTGLPGAFTAAGFREVARPSKSRRIMRRTIRG
jgi:GNAT superfamily N-acetyltransferase